MQESQVVEVYSASNGHEAHSLNIALEDAGIQARVVGEQLQSAAGELPLGWSIAPRIWVRKADAERAKKIITRWEEMCRSESASAATPTWICPHCSEEVEGNFDVCWNCQQPRTADDGG